jgi:pimeloyl-[acyl-carrier protein] methyl ester esterase
MVPRGSEMRASVRRRSAGYSDRMEQMADELIEEGSPRLQVPHETDHAAPIERPAARHEIEARLSAPRSFAGAMLAMVAASLHQGMYLFRARDARATASMLRRDRNMTTAPTPLLTFLLPGLDGTGTLFSRFVAAGSGALELRVLRYPHDRILGYAELADHVLGQLPSDRPFALVGESFGGPLALRVAATCPPGLAGVVLVSSFHARPGSALIQALRPLSFAFFRLPLPDHAVRLLLGGRDAPAELVAEVRAAVASVRPDVMIARARAAMRVDASAFVKGCPVPLLFLGGKQDRLLRTALPFEIRMLRPDAEIRMLDAPHLLLQRQPELAMRVVEEFLIRRAGAPRGAVQRQA